jgi:uncharacterized protein (DUF433 family)
MTLVRRRRCALKKRKPDITDSMLKADPREIPAYSVRTAAHYLQIPPATLKTWVSGRHYPTKRDGAKFWQPVIELPDREIGLLSFFNVAEAHVLSAFRTIHGIKMPQIRKALNFVKNKFGCDHPLIDAKFETDGAALFVEKLGAVVDASAGGQLVMDTVKAHFQRLDHVNAIVARLYPFTRSTIEGSPKIVFMDPRYAFGRPCLAKCHIPTVLIAERYKAGESIDGLAKDYGCTPLEIEEGVRCELGTKLAA